MININEYSLKSHGETLFQVEGMVHALFVNRHRLATSSHVHELDVIAPWPRFEALANLESLAWRVL